MARFPSGSHVRPNEIRGHGPKHDTWPASLPQVTYITADGGHLCVTCANSDGSLAVDASDQWRIIGAQVNQHHTTCDHCERIIVDGRPRPHDIPTVRQTACRLCGLDVENITPFRADDWRDRGNNTHCPDGRLHEPMRDTD